MTDDVSELPAWPEYPKFAPNYVEWLQKDRDAYCARMDALVDHINEKAGMPHRADCALYLHSGELGIRCDCGLDALLSACEREEG